MMICTSRRMWVGASLAALAFLVSGCGGEQRSISNNHGDVQVRLLEEENSQRSSSFDFGDVEAGTSKRVTLTLVNVGPDSVELTSPRFEEVPKGSFFALAPRSLGAGEEDELVLTFSPQEVDEYAGRVILEHSGDSNFAVIELHGRGL